MKLPISAMVVGFNEGSFLKQCLKSLTFCDEILYTDLGSQDSSIEVAMSFTDKIYTRPLAPSGEYIQSEMIKYTNNDWVIFIDPDEVIDKSLGLQIRDEFHRLSNSLSIGAVLVPWHFYFKSSKLKGTIWGGNNKKYLLVNKNRFEFLPITHYGRNIKSGFNIYEIMLNDSKNNILHHFWMSSYKVFFKKHMRYLKKEGRDNYNQGARINGIKKLLSMPFVEFSKCYFNLRGYKDGTAGFILSLFWAYYKTRIALDILYIQRKNLMVG